MDIIKINISCDSCRQTIKTTDDVWIEWLVNDKTGVFYKKRLKIVHHNRTLEKANCQCDEYKFKGYTLHDLPLNYCINWQVFALEAIRDGNLSVENGLNFLKIMFKEGEKNEM